MFSHIFDEVIKLQTKYEYICESLCPPNCEESYYGFDVYIGHDATVASTWSKPKHQFSIIIRHDSVLDQIVEHRPILSWIELVSNFGGLLGMWLGLSVVFIFDSILKYI